MTRHRIKIAAMGILLLVLNFNVFAQEDDEKKEWGRLSLEEKFKENPQKAFDENPTAENFKRSNVPKISDNFGKLNDNDKLITWRQLNSAEQGKYLNDKDYSYDTDKALAHLFFDNAGNVNNNREAFKNYAKSVGVIIDISNQGMVSSYSNAGLLVAQNGQVNIIQFKDKYSFKIDENNNLILIDLFGNQHSFEGMIEIDNTGNIRMENGIIDGLSVTGQGIYFGKDGDGFAQIHVQKALEFNGIKLAEPTSIFYGASSDTTHLFDASIIELADGTRIFGKNVILPENNKIVDGAIVWHNDKHIKLLPSAHIETSNRESIVASQLTTHVYINDINFNPDLHQNENYVYTLKGKSFDIQTIEGGEINADILPGHDLFNTFRKEYLKEEAFFEKSLRFALSEEERNRVLEIADKEGRGEALIQEEAEYLEYIRNLDLKVTDPEELMMLKDARQRFEEELVVLREQKLKVEDEIIEVDKTFRELDKQFLEKVRQRNDAAPMDRERLEKEVEEARLAFNSYIEEQRSPLFDKLKDIGGKIEDKKRDEIFGSYLPEGYSLRKEDDFVKFNGQEGYQTDDNGFAYRLVGDNHDNVEITVRDGDSINVDSGGDNIPLFLHVSDRDNGNTNLCNGRNCLSFDTTGVFRTSEITTFEFGDYGQFLEAKKALREMKAGEYQSIGLRMEDDFSPIVIDYANHIQSEDGRFTLNGLGFPLSESKAQVLIQTPDDLAAKYGIPVELDGVERLTPNTIAILDFWLQDDGDKLDIYEKGIRIEEDGYAANSGKFLGKSQMVIGEIAMDPYTYPLMPVRTVPDVITILDHEYVHGFEHRLEFMHENEKYSREEWESLGIPKTELDKLSLEVEGLDLGELKEQGVDESYFTHIREPADIVNDIVFEHILPIVNSEEYRLAVENFAKEAAGSQRGVLSSHYKRASELISVLNGHYREAGLEPIDTDQFFEIYLSRFEPEEREEMEQATKELLEFSESISVFGQIFDPKSTDKRQAAIMQSNEFINYYDRLFAQFPGYYKEGYVQNFEKMKELREGAGFVDHALDPSTQSFIGLPLPPSSFPEVTSTFAELSDEEIKIRASAPGVQGEIAQDLLQYFYDVGFYSKDQYEKLRGISCSEQNPCEKGVLWKFGALESAP